MPTYKKYFLLDPKSDRSVCQFEVKTTQRAGPTGEDTYEVAGVVGPTALVHALEGAGSYPGWSLDELLEHITDKANKKGITGFEDLVLQAAGGSGAERKGR